MARFKRLTDAEARTLTRAELLDRVESEQRYWARKRSRTDAAAAADVEAEIEFGRIMHTYLNPADGLRDLREYLEGTGAGDYWDSRPGDETEEGQ